MMMNLFAPLNTALNTELNNSVKRRLKPVVLPLLLAAPSLQAAELTIEITGIPTVKGAVLVALYDDPGAYDANQRGMSAMVKVTGETETVVFKDLAEGDYAVKLFHDENGNYKLDTNMLGLPKEGYGFSNNQARFGPSSFEEARFSVKQDTDIEIKVF